MYLEHFGLTVNPFGISPRLDFLFRSNAFEESMAHLAYGLNNSEAIVMITGAVGTGKTMAVQSFLAALGDPYVSALVTNTSVDGKELLKLILEDLDCVQPSGADKSDLLIAFKQFLVAAGKRGKRIVIVIDEAQNLAREVLEEVRLLTNLGQGEEQPVQIILVGQPELEAAVGRPDMAQLRQRIRVHWRLTPLSRRELENYVDHRMQVAGGADRVFTAAALDRIYEASGGVPRVVNTLCDQALLSAFVAGKRTVDARELAETWEASTSEQDPAQGRTLPGDSAALGPRTRGPVADMAVRRAGDADADRVGRSTSERVRATTRRRALMVAALAVVVVASVLVWKWQDLSDLRVSGQGGASAASGPVQQESEVVASGNSITPLADERPDPEGGPFAASDTLGVPESPLVVAVENGVPGADAETVREEPAAVIVPVEDDPQPLTRERTAGSDAETCYLHVSSFRTSDHANAVAQEFAARGIPAVVRGQLVRDVQWYRVYLGPFDGHAAAVHRANELRGTGAITYYKVSTLGDGGGS